MTEPSISAPAAFADEGLHESALVLGADSHPRFELACDVLRAMGFKPTVTKQRRHDVILYGPSVEEATLRAINAKNAYTVEQLLHWIGADGPIERLARKLAEAVDARKRGAYARPSVEAILEAWPEESVAEAVRSVDLELAFVSNPSMRRVLRGQRDPRATLAERAKVNRAAPRDWVRTFLPHRAALRRELTLDFSAHHDRIEPLREAIELLHGCPLHGIALGQRSKPGSPSLGALVDSLPEGLRSLELSALQPNELQAFADASALRTVEQLSASSTASISGAIARFARSFEQLRTAKLLSFGGDDEIIPALCGTNRVRSLERLKIYRSAISDAHLSMLAAACPRQSLRELDLNSVNLSPAGAATLATHPSFANVESLTLVADAKESQFGANLLRFASECTMKSLRTLCWTSYAINAANSASFVAAVDGNPAFASLRTLTIRLVGSDAWREFERVRSPIELEALQLDSSDPSVLARGDFWRSPWLSALKSLQFSGGYSSGALVTPDTMAEAPESLRSLSISGLPLSPVLIEALTRAPFASNLRDFSYFGADYAEGTIAALCSSPFVETLNVLALSARPISVDDQWRLRRAFGPALWLV